MYMLLHYKGNGLTCNPYRINSVSAHTVVTFEYVINYGIQMGVFNAIIIQTSCGTLDIVWQSQKSGIEEIVFKKQRVNITLNVIARNLLSK